MDDKLDELLHRLPESRTPAGIARRTVLAVRRRQRRRLILQYSLSAAMVAAGAVLFVPWVIGYLTQVELPRTGFPLLASTLDAVYNTAPAVANTWQGINAIQATLSHSFGILETAGLIILTAGTLLGIGPLLSNTPPADQRVRSL